MIQKLKNLISEWQDGILWIPIAILLLLAVTIFIPMFDPRAGIDGLGFLQGYAALVLKGVLITFLAWLCKRTYTIDHTLENEVEMIAASAKGSPWPLIIDRLEWAGWITLWYVVLSS